MVVVVVVVEGRGGGVGVWGGNVLFTVYGPKK